MSGFIPVAGQTQDEGGLRVGLTYSEQIYRDDDDTVLRSGLDVSLSSRTRTDSLDIGFGGNLDKDSVDLTASTLTNQFARLNYTRESRDIALTFFADFRRIDLEDDTDIDSETLALQGFVPLVIDEGQREDINAGFSYTFGRTAPFGGTVSFSHSDTRFIDTFFTTQVDSTNTRGQVDLRFDHTPNITQFVSLSLGEIDRDGGIDVEETRLNSRVEVEVDPRLTLTAGLGVARVITSGAVPRTEEDGLTASLGATLARPNGTLSATLATDLSETGRRTDLSVNRAFELPRGRLSVGAGLSRDEDTNDVEPLYSLDYLHRLPRTEFRASLNQSFSTSSLGREQLDSRLGVSVSHELSDISSVSASLTLRDIDQFGAGAVDADQVDIGLNYTRALRANWSLFGGISHYRLQRDNGADESDDRVFIGLRTSLEWRP